MQYYKAAGYSSAEIETRLRESRRHRHVEQNANSAGAKGNAVAPPSTPEGFWSISNLNSQSGQGDTQQPEETLVRRLRRRRPLELPKPPHA